jgi:hypothetical protein
MHDKISRATSAIAESISLILASDGDGDEKAFELARSFHQMEEYLTKQLSGEVVATPPAKTSAEAADSFRGGGYVDHLADKVADMLIETKRFPDRASVLSYLMHNRDGVALLRRMSLHKGSNMDTVEKLESARAANLRKLGDGAIEIAKSIVAKEANVVNLTEEEFTAVITAHAQKLYPADRADVAFAKVFAADEMIRRAYQIVKALPPVLDFQPIVVDGATAFQDALEDRSAAHDALVELASKLRARVPQMTPAQAYEKVLQDPVNRELAIRALNPPPPPGAGGFPFPHTSSPGRQ